MTDIAPELLKAAAQAVASFGLRRTSLSDVAVQAGVSRATAYRAFGDRDSMLRAVLADEMARMLAAFERKAVEVETAQGLIEAYLDQVLDSARESPIASRALGEESDLLLAMLVARPDGRSLVGYGTSQTGAALTRLGAEELFALPIDNVAEILTRTAVSLLLDPTSTVSDRGVLVEALAAATAVRA